MEDKERRMISFEVSADQLEVIEARATKAGLSRSEYLRARSVSDPVAVPNDSLETLLRQVLYVIARIHAAVYSIAETAGTVSTDRLYEIYDECAQEGMRYLEELPKAIAKVQAQITAQTTAAPPAAEKGAA